MNGAERSYDERLIRDRVTVLPAARRVAFAAACAEWLFPCYEKVFLATMQGDPVALRGVVDAAWSLAAAEVIARDELEQLCTLAESLVPNDDDDTWSTLSPLAQNAAASAAYALRAWLLDDPQQAVWAARQLFEAGDFLVQLAGPVHSYVATDSDEPASLAIGGIALALTHSEGHSLTVMRTAAASGGWRLRRLLQEPA